MLMVLAAGSLIDGTQRKRDSALALFDIFNMAVYPFGRLDLVEVADVAEATALYAEARHRDIAARVARHRAMAERCWEWVEAEGARWGLKVLAPERFSLACPGVTPGTR